MVLLFRKWISTGKRLKLDPCVSPCTKINSKWVKDLNVRSESLKLLQENLGETLRGLGNDFLNRTPVAWEIRMKMDKWDSIK
jgi:hypothetical protein